MSPEKSRIPPSLSRILATTPPRRDPIPFKKPGHLTSSMGFEIPAGYVSRGVVIVEDFQLQLDTVPDDVHQRAGLSDDVIIRVKAESVVKDGRLVGDRIVAEYFVRFLCC